VVTAPKRSRVDDAAGRVRPKAGRGIGPNEGYKTIQSSIGFRHSRIKDRYDSLGFLRWPGWPVEVGKTTSAAESTNMGSMIALSDVVPGVAETKFGQPYAQQMPPASAVHK
jgi:hypothetical protein